MSAINEVRERLKCDAEDFTERGLAIPTANDIRALLADHAELQKHGEEYREKIRDMYREQYAREELIDRLEAVGRTPPGVSPAPDLEQGLRDLYRAYVRLLESGRDRIMSLGGNCDPVDVMERSDIDLRKVRDLLALIDGQAAQQLRHSSEVAADLVAEGAVRRLVRAMENTPGDELIEPNTRLCRRLLAAALQPTKGEGE